MKVRCNQCMKVFEEEEIVYDSERDMEFCPKCGEDGCLMDFAKTIYCVSGLGYDKDDCTPMFRRKSGITRMVIGMSRSGKVLRVASN